MTTSERILRWARKVGWEECAKVVRDLPKCGVVGCNRTAIVIGDTILDDWVYMCIRHFRKLGRGIGPELGRVLVRRPKIQELIERLVNLTPHPIVLITEGGRTVEIPPSGHVARAKENKELVGTLGDGDFSIPLYRIAYGEPEGFPGIDPDAYYIVSSVTARAIKDCAPEYLAKRFVVVTDLVRDESGRVIGARGLSLVT